MTGGAGFIDSHLVDALVNRGHGDTVLDNLSSGELKNIEPHLKKKSAHLVEGHVRNLTEVREALTEVEKKVFHLAVITSLPYSVENLTATNEVNAVGTRNLLEATAEKDVKRFIYVQHVRYTVNHYTYQLTKMTDKPEVAIR